MAGQNKGFLSANSRLISKAPLLGAFFDVFLPNRCLVCDKYISSDKIICDSCVSELESLNPVPFREKIGINAYLYHYGYYDGIISKIILSYKYGNHRALSKILAQMLWIMITEWKIKSKTITGIPSHRQSDNKRGFSNTGFIIRNLQTVQPNHYNITELFVRKGKYIPQASLKDAAKRKENAEKSYFVKKTFSKENDVPEESIIVFDDVYTTGYTMKRAIKLLKGNYETINCMVIARKKE